jgi:hypothetical protein
MSKINGDKARFHRDRKRRIERRANYRKLFENAALPPAATPREAKAQARAL